MNLNQEIYQEIKSDFNIILNSSNNNEITQSTNSIQNFMKNYHAQDFLLRLIISPTESQSIKLLALVEARKLDWEVRSSEKKSLFLSALLNLLTNNPSNQSSDQVNHAITHLVSKIAKYHPLDLSIILSLLNTDAHTEIGLYLLVDLFSHIPDQLEQIIPSLSQILICTIKKSFKSQILTVQALSKIADFIDPDDSLAIASFQAFIPLIVDVLSQCLAARDDQASAKIFEFFDDILILETPLLTPHFTNLFNLFLSISTTIDHSSEIRVQALSFLMWCIVSNKAKIAKAKLIPSILHAMFIIAGEDEAEDGDDDYPSKLAVQVINALATTFPPQQVFPEAMQLSIKAIQSTIDSDRKAAMLAIAVLVDGCADFMRSNLDDVLHLVILGLQDSSTVVRKAGCMALGALCDDFEEELVVKHAILLPLLFNIISDSDTSVHSEALGTLDVMVESLGDEITPYIPGLMSRLLTLWGIGSRKVQITTTNCIGSVAFASSSKFTPYFDSVIKILASLLTLSDPSDLGLRSVATECVGPVATAVGKDLFRPLLPDMMTCVVIGLQYDSPQLKQCSFVLFGVLGALFGDEFAPYLHVIVPPILQIASTPEKEFGIAEESDREVVDDADDEEEKPMFASAVAQEKESSIDTLGELFRATKSAFMPFVPDSINISLELLSHYHDSLRMTAASTLLKFFETAYLMNNAASWTPGLPLNIELHENVLNIGKLAVEGILIMLDEEDEREVVTRTLQALTESLTITGPALVAQSFEGQGLISGSHLDALSNQLKMVLSGEHACQDQDDSFDDEELNEVAELDALVISAAADTVGALANSIGPQFAPFFEQFLPLIAKFYKPGHGVADRSMAIGAIAEAVQGLESGVVPFTANLIQLFSLGLGDDEDEVRSNAAFGIGVLCAYSPSLCAGHYPQIFQLLHPLFKISVTNIRDNACGALCRMTLANPSCVPFEHVLPAILDSLPLTQDVEENEPIYKCIIGLLNSGNEYVFSYLLASNHVLRKEEIGGDTLALVCKFIRGFRECRGSDYAQIVSDLGEYAMAIQSASQTL